MVPPSVTGAGLDLGEGHWLRWAAWRPDRYLNPQYAGLPDVDQCTGIIRHPLRPADTNPTCREQGFCEGAITIDGPVTRQLFSGRALWQMTAAEPVTLTPSLLCHCGDHGHITAGRWVPA